MTKNDPTSLRVYRGGGWVSTDPARVLATYRYTVAPAYRINFLSFRTALPVRQPR